MSGKADMTVVCAILSVALAAWAGDSYAGDEALSLKGVVVTATKTEKDIEGMAATVLVIDEDEIKQMGAASLRDVFEKTPELTMQFGRFPHPSSKSKSSISIRGMGSNGTLILVDGKRLAGETERPYELDRIPASMIERIEIVKGSMSTLYGSDAVGGVINIITKKPEQGFKATAGVRGGLNAYGDRESGSANLGVSGRQGGFGYKLFGNYDKTKPYTENEAYTSKSLNPSTNLPVPGDSQHLRTGEVAVSYRDKAEVFNLGGRVEYELSGSLKAGVDANYFEESREGLYRGAFRKTNSAPPPPVVMVVDTPVKSEDDNKRWDYSGDIEYARPGEFIGSLRVWRSEYEKRNRTTALDFTAPVNLKFSADVAFTGYEAQGTYFTGKHALTGGAEYRSEVRDSAAINPNPQSFDFIRKEIGYTSVYLQDDWQITDTLGAIFGARFDDISDAYEDSKATFKAGVVKNFSPSLNVRLNYAEGYRTPDVAELFVVSPTPGDVPRVGAEAVFGLKTTTHELKPEFARSYEAGASGEYGKLDYSAVIFFNDIDDKIELERVDVTGDGNADYLTSVNKTEVETRGFEAAIGYDFGKGLSSRINWAELRTEDKATGKELLFNPERTASLNVKYDIDGRYIISATARYIGEQLISDTEKAGAYTLVDLNVSAGLGKDRSYEVYAGIDNIFNERVDKALGSNVGAFYFAGLRIAI